MENNKIINLDTDLNKSIEKNFRKYTLEVDDAIEAHGFKASSYIDYAENRIEELENAVKIQVNENGMDMLFTNLESALKNTVTNITDHTRQTAYERNDNHLYEKIDNKVDELHSLLGLLNTRLINSFEI